MPAVRLRRLREKRAIRDWVSETQLNPKSIILPYFVVEGKKIKEPIESMPCVYRLSIDNLLKDITEAVEIQAILLFGIPMHKDSLGFGAYKKNGIVQKAIRAIRKQRKDLIVITDVCLCGYASHGHCGIIKKRPEFAVDNDKTLEVLAKIALSHAEAGADFVAPSAMMDGQVRAIREVLDKKDFEEVGIMGYSAKYASNFYGPFRDALHSAPQFGDRKSYQMDYRNSDKALREIKQDIEEGVDIVMVKPALGYLDIIYRIKQKFNIPIAAYNVSGEYSMVKKYAQSREIEKDMVLEILTGIKRAGADFIITYWAKDLMKWLK
ncbi:MAG: porphobilinogen synthase [Candidatus Omnitrophica bacterium]|nr:porphobilinogen synthase [Candidatus Omnitrophota bacterium]